MFSVIRNVTGVLHIEGKMKINAHSHDTQTMKTVKILLTF